MKFFRKIYFAVCDYIVCKIELSQLDLNIAKIKDCVTGKNGQVNEAYVLYAHLKHILDEDVSARNFMYASLSNHGNFLSAARSKYEEVLMINFLPSSSSRQITNPSGDLKPLSISIT